MENTFNTIDLPKLLYHIYYDHTLIMPHCTSHIYLKGHEAKKALYIYQNNIKAGFILKNYKYEQNKIGCYAHIDTINTIDEKTIALKLEGIIRFKDEFENNMPYHSHKRLHLANYSPFIYNVNNSHSLINISDLSPLIGQTFIETYTELGFQKEDITITVLIIR